MDVCLGLVLHVGFNLNRLILSRGQTLRIVVVLVAATEEAVDDGEPGEYVDVMLTVPDT